MPQEELSTSLLNCILRLVRSDPMRATKTKNSIGRGELGVLLYLAYMQDGVSAKVLATDFHVNSSRIAAILNSLENKHYIERVKDETDGRMIHVNILKEGKEYIDGALSQVNNRIDKTIAKMQPEEAQEFIRLFHVYLDILEGNTR